jgi:hypothetical protein
MTGWTMYVPLSTREFMPTNGMDLVILGRTLLCVVDRRGAGHSTGVLWTGSDDLQLRGGGS